MGNKRKRSAGSKDKRKDKRQRAADLLDGDDTERLITKLVKWSQQGKHRWLNELLKEAGTPGAQALAGVKDVSGRTLLHLACEAGYPKVVRTLLKHGADPQALDHQGNTPAHLAAAAQQLLTLHALMEEHPQDLRQCNAAGRSVQDLLHRMLEPETGAGGGHVHAYVHEGQQAGDGAASSGSEGSSEAWRRRLREEASDGDGGGCSAGEAEQRKFGSRAAEQYARPGGLPAALRACETEDEWADRMWGEMQARRRAAARASARLFEASAQQVRAQQEAEAAAAHAARMARLQEAQATLRFAQQQDTAWRQRVAGLIGPAAPAQAMLDPSVARASYEDRWSALEARVSAVSTAQPKLRMLDIPWPLPEGAGYTTDALSDVVLHGVTGPGDIRARLRGELMRWHPDKFTARFGGLLEPSHAARVHDRVKDVSQCLTRMMTGGTA